MSDIQDNTTEPEQLPKVELSIDVTHEEEQRLYEEIEEQIEDINEELDRIEGIEE